MDEKTLLFIPLIDLVALLWLFVSWIVYSRYTKRCSSQNNRGLLAAMNRSRDKWAQMILLRENRIIDSQVVNGLVRKASFFGSTTLLILASTVALLGLGDQFNQLFAALPFAQPIPLALWEAKVAVLAITFIYAFFKFTWSIRQHSYCAILIASLPMPDQVMQNPAAATVEAQRLARLGNLAGRHFNDGMRAYYFALAELSWFIHPLLFIVSTVWVILVLFRREFHSKTLEILS